jgi:hypothetical protein
MKSTYRNTGLLAVFFGLVLTVSAQDINKEVYVVRPYEPTLSDASKYNFLPNTSAIETTVPKFQYSITPKHLQNSFEPDPIKAAKTVTTSLSRIYNSWLKLGLGNYSTPLVEFNISNLRSKETAYGAYMRHKSSHSKISLANDDKINAGYVENNINVYGKRFFKDMTLSGNLTLDQYAFNYYGLNTELFSSTPHLEKDSLRQRVYKPGLAVGLKSNASDKQKLNFALDGTFDYFFDRYKNKEPRFILNTSVSKEVSELTGGLDVSVDYSRLSGDLDTTNNTIFRFNPWISKSSPDWSFKIGFEAVADISDITRYYFYPQINLDIIVVKDVLVPFVGISGSLQKNGYQQLFSENRFIIPALSLKNTSSNFILYGGLKGNISSVVRFRADVNLTVYKNFHFFINDTITGNPLYPMQNQFAGVYDDINLITYHGQLVISPNENYELSLDGKYFNYKMFEQKKPWHQPDFNVSADATYRVSKMEFGAGINIIGTRWVKDYYVPDEMRKLKPVLDANLSVQYHYSKLLTLFANLNNITDNSYLLWNQYPVQRFNFMFGFTYKL